MLRVGLTGGVASGKSTVSALLAGYGAVVIDSDLLAREAVAVGTPGLAAVLIAFGPDVLTDNGELDRPAMGRRVFGDPEARARLEAIVHPRVRARAADLEARAPTDAVVVHDIPLLVETGQGDQFDEVVVVDVPPDVQVDRLRRDRAMTAEEARSRIAAQSDRQQRLAAADYVIVNDGSREQLRAAVEQLWQDLCASAARRT